MSLDIDAMRERRRLPYAGGLTLATAKEMLDAGVQEAEKRGMPVTIAIVDAGGNLVALNRMDNAVLFSIQIAIDKAYTAVFGKWHTGNWGRMFQSSGLTPLFFHDRWLTLPGGFPLLKNGAILGGIAASGATHEDLYAARAALEAGGFSLDEVEAAIAEIAGGNNIPASEQ